MNPAKEYGIQIIVIGFPSADLFSVREAFAIIWDIVGIEIGADAIIDVRSRPFAMPHDFHDSDAADFAAGHGTLNNRSPQIFVRFAFVEFL